MNNDDLRRCPECGSELEWDIGDVFWEMTIRCENWISCPFCFSVPIPDYMLRDLFEDAVAAYEKEQAEDE